MTHPYKEVYKNIFQQILELSPKAIFDEAALPSYTHSNKLMSFLFWKRVDIALQMAGNVHNRSVLDFGCGGAVTFKYLKDNNCKITGCDNQFLELTKQISDRLDIKANFLKDLFDASDTYDRIFALDVLEHIGQIEPYLYKLKTLLKEGGQIVVSGPTENVLYKIGRSLAGFSGHYHVRNIYQIEKSLLKAGFQRIRIKSLYPIIPLFRVSLWEKSG